MIIAPKHLNPILENDLNKLNPNHFESLCFECNLNTDHSNKKELLIDVSYNHNGLRTLNTNIPTRVKDDFQTLIDYIMTHLNNSEKFSNIISDTPLGTQKNKPIDHFAPTIIMDIKTKRRTNVTIKEIFDKIYYSKEFSQHTVVYSDCGIFYNQTCAGGMFTVFVNKIETALKKGFPKKKVFIRIDKSDIAIHSSGKTNLVNFVLK